MSHVCPPCKFSSIQTASVCYQRHLFRHILRANPHAAVYRILHEFQIWLFSSQDQRCPLKKTKPYKSTAFRFSCSRFQCMLYKKTVIRIRNGFVLSFSDGYSGAVFQYKIIRNIGYKIHVDQKTLMASQKAVIHFFL